MRTGSQPGVRLFKPRDCVEMGGGGPAATAAALSFDQVIGQPHQSRFAQWQASAAARLGQLEQHFVHDLASEIGSARWYRGAATLAVLATTALALWPDFSRLEAAPATHVDRTVRDEFRSQMVMPLALGGESGRHMAANPALVTRLAAVPEQSSLRMVATLGDGDGLTRMLQRAGVGPWDAARTAELIGAVMPIAELKPGTRFDITLGRRGADGEARPLDALAFRARFDTALTISRADGHLTIGREAIAVDTTPLRIRGTVGVGLYRSARAAGAPPEAVQQYLQAIDRHLGLDEVVPGDQFDIVVEQKRSAGGEAEIGKLIYAGLDHGGKPRAQLLRLGGKGDLIDAISPGSGSAMLAQPTGTMMMPVAGRITSSFGLRRHPILGYTRMHSGIDFGAARGSPIVAVASGVVTFAGRHGGHGNFVRLDHGGGLGTGYGHMSRIAVSSGTQVSAGQVIGYVGSTGLSTGPHLHYEVYQNGRPVNPMSVSFEGVRMRPAPVDPARLDELRKRLDAIKAIQPLGSINTAKVDRPAHGPRAKLAYRD
jgi:murein DD-endopeptidase MepM/ murein hydrolase activator NlpD